MNNTNSKQIIPDSQNYDPGDPTHNFLLILGTLVVLDVNIIRV